MRYCEVHPKQELIKKTVYNRAKGCFQYLVEDHLFFCPKCQSKEIQEILKNPLPLLREKKECHRCHLYNNCNVRVMDEASLVSDSIDDHTSMWGGAGPDCMPMPG